MVASTASVTRSIKYAIVSIRDEIHSYIVREGKTVKDVYVELARHGLEGSYQNFNRKIKSGTLRYEDAHKIADVLGYDIVWKKRNP